jgi:hypothetical protein
MAALVWDRTSEHWYETGISKGVLFTANNDSTAQLDTPGWNEGVAWSGLISVSESPEGADEEAFYADNIKYLALRGVEDFGGSISAYQSPEEFDECDGSVALNANYAGVTIGQQPRKAFCLAYVTQKGNDVEGNEAGYVIHIIYNATASPSEREYQTINDSPEPNELSWDFSSSPVPVTGHKPTSIVRIDSTKFTTQAAKAKLKTIEDALFGVDADQTASITEVKPHVLLPNDIITILAANG